MSGHDDYDPSYYFTVDITSYDENEYNWSQEQWAMRCLNCEMAGLDHYGFMKTPLWVQQSVNLLRSFHNIEMDRQRDRERSAMEARRGTV